MGATDFGAVLSCLSGSNQTDSRYLQSNSGGASVCYCKHWSIPCSANDTLSIAAKARIAQSFDQFFAAFACITMLFHEIPAQLSNCRSLVDSKYDGQKPSLFKLSKLSLFKLSLRIVSSVCTPCSSQPVCLYAFCKSGTL